MARKALVLSLVAACVAVFGVTGIAKETTVTSQWSAAPIRIDGLDQDWQDAIFLTDPGSKAQYAVKNDAANLYVLFVFKDDKSWTTLEYTGLKVFFNTEGKKSKDLGVFFTKRPMETEKVIAEVEKRGQPLTDEQKAELRKQKAHLVFVEEPINDQKLAAPSDPAVKTDAPAYRSARKQGAIFCEFRIPLSRVNEERGIGTEPGKAIKLGFEWGGMTREIMRNIMADRAASGAVARQGSVEMSTSDRSGEGGGGGGPDFSDFSRDAKFKKHSFWIDLTLASK